MFFERFFQAFLIRAEEFLNVAGTNPFSAMWYLFVHGGWILFVWAILWGVQHLYLDYIQGKAVGKKEWILLRITVPKASEQTPKAVENLFAYLAGAHQSASWTDTWVRGYVQSPISMEIASLGGKVFFFIRAERKMRDLVEASVYSQYPDAEIQEADDYAKKVPSHYPDEEWDAWGVEMIPVAPDSYSLKTYHDLVDAVSGEFKDNLAAMLEGFSRLSPDEQAWYQIVLTPTDQKAARKKAQALISKLKGIEEKHKKSLLQEIIEIPFVVLKEIGGVLLGTSAPPKKEEKKDDKFPKLFALSPQEREILEAVERKAGKINFECKIRFLYIAKKAAMQKSRAAHPFIGAIKQTNTFHMQALKPEMKEVGNSGAIWFFKDLRNNIRKHHLIMGYRNRSSWSGMPRFSLSVEELATLWHFPILMQVKAPQLLRTEAKKQEPPSNIPFG